MSTLGSTQLHVTRSSTRRHAPPGGGSSLSFGPGGFGTPNAAAPVNEPGDDHIATNAMGSRPTTTHSDRPETDEDTNVHHQPRTMQSSVQGQGFGSNSNATNAGPQHPQEGGMTQFQFQSQSQSQPHWNSNPPLTKPTTSNHGMNASPAQSSNQEQQYGSPGGQPVLRTSNTSAAYNSATINPGASPQPPLTASRRDQNWAKKRRMWAQRKATNSGMPPQQGFAAGSNAQPSRIEHSQMNSMPRSHAEQPDQMAASRQLSTDSLSDFVATQQHPAQYQTPNGPSTHQQQQPPMYNQQNTSSHQVPSPYPPATANTTMVAQSSNSFGNHFQGPNAATTSYQYAGPSSMQQQQQQQPLGQFTSNGPGSNGTGMMHQGASMTTPRSALARSGANQFSSMQSTPQTTGAAPTSNEYSARYHAQYPSMGTPQSAQMPPGQSAGQQQSSSSYRQAPGGNSNWSPYS